MPCVPEASEEWAEFAGAGEAKELRSLFLSDLHLGVVKGRMLSPICSMDFLQGTVIVQWTSLGAYQNSILPVILPPWGNQLISNPSLGTCWISAVDT